MRLLYTSTPGFVLNKWKLRKTETVSPQKDTLSSNFQIYIEDDKRPVPLCMKTQKQKSRVLLFIHRKNLIKNVEGLV